MLRRGAVSRASHWQIKVGLRILPCPTTRHHQQQQRRARLSGGGGAFGGGGERLCGRVCVGVGTEGLLFRGAKAVPMPVAKKSSGSSPNLSSRSPSARADRA